MLNPVLFHHEKERLEVLYSYDLLDSATKESYNHLINLAAHICNTPISFISLIDKECSWLKATLGFSAKDYPHHATYINPFFNHPNEVFVLKDIKDDDFFATLFSYKGLPIRFYAGVALVSTGGHVLGTLSVMDIVPHYLDEKQINGLKKLAHQVVSQFELHKKNKEVQQLNNQLANLHDEFDAFTYSVSHDLKGPLRAIKGFSELIVEDYMEELEEDAKDLFQQVITSTNQLESFLHNILILSRISRKELKYTELNLMDIVHQVLEKIPALDSYTIKIEPDLEAYGDFDLIETVLTHLIDNAIKFSHKVEHPSIEIGQKLDKEQPVFFIKDNGVGFDMRYVDSIFKPFQRLHGESEFEGTGVGLAIVHKIIKRHGGDIWVESEQDEGATFYFTISHSKIK